MFSSLKLSPIGKSRYPVETGLLIAFCVFLPLLEAPKNILWLAYAACWLVNRIRSRDFGGRWDLWDTLIAAWIASGFVVAAFAGLHGNEWNGAGDPLRYGSLLWLVKRGGYTQRELRWMVGTLVLSTVAGLAHGFWRLWTGRDAALHINSVGHVNHTAIYIAIMLGVCTSWLYAWWKSWTSTGRALGLAATALMLAALVVTASRGAIGVGLAMLPLLALGWWPRWRVPLAASGIAVALIAVIAVLGGAEVVRKHQRDMAEQNVLAFRDGIWRMALAGFERYPAFGVGMDNFKLITHERVKAWRTEAGEPFDPKRFVHFPHAHSLYLNTLAERGLVGFVPLMAVMALWAVFLVRYRPRPQYTDDEWLLWGCAAAAWIVTFGAGLANTTLHHEHGILAALFLGAWLSTLRARRAS